jgi:hypothetical protein
MHQDLVASGGQMHSWFGMDLSSTPFTHHGANQGLLIIPYLALIGMAIFFQYYQMKQMNSRNPQAAAANPQMQTMQKFFPIIFGVIYLRVPAGATIYMVVSSAMRIGTQELMFRTGMVTPMAAEREIGPAAKGGGKDPDPTNGKTTGNGSGKAAPKGPAQTKKPTVTDGTGLGNGSTPTPRKKPVNGKNAASAHQEIEQAPAPKEHPRSRSKRTRKAR